MANQISPMAFVHPEAILGDNNIIGPFCYIDRNVVIGDNNVFQNSFHKKTLGKYVIIHISSDNRSCHKFYQQRFDSA